MPDRRHPLSLRRGVLTLVALLFLTSLNARGAAPDFTRDIKPILERSCFGCHGPEKQKSGYRLDVRDIALKGGDSGKPAIVPHNAKASPLIHYVSGEDAEMLMPPASSKVARLMDRRRPCVARCARRYRGGEETALVADAAGQAVGASNQQSVSRTQAVRYY